MRGAVFSARIVIALEGFGMITVVGTEIPAYFFEKRRHSGMAMGKIDMSTWVNCATRCVKSHRLS